MRSYSSGIATVAYEYTVRIEVVVPMLDPETVIHLQERLRVYRRNLHHLLDQVAQHGGEATAPLPLINSIHEARDNIRGIKAELRAGNVSVEDHPDDARPLLRVASSPLDSVASTEPNETPRATPDTDAPTSRLASAPVDKNMTRQTTLSGPFPRNTRRFDWSAIYKGLRDTLLFTINMTVAACLGISFLGALASLSNVGRLADSGSGIQPIPAYLLPWTFFFSLLVAVPVLCLWILITVHSSRLRKQQERLQNNVERLYEMPEILEYMAEYDRRLFSTVWENWLDFLRYLKKRSQRAEDILRHCVPLEIQGEKLIVGCSSSVIRRQINGSAENSPKASIEKALYDFYGKPSKITSIIKDDTEIVQIKAKLYAPQTPPEHSLDDTGNAH